MIDVGRIRRAVGLRDQVVIVTKGGHPDMATPLKPRLAPDEIVATPIEDLAALLKEHSRGRVADPEELARVVKQAANRSYQLPKGMVEPVNLILSSSLTTVRALKGQLKPIEKTIATELAAAPAQTLATIPGLGPVFTAGIVSEIGDVGRF